MWEDFNDLVAGPLRDGVECFALGALFFSGESIRRDDGLVAAVVIGVGGVVEEALTFGGGGFRGGEAEAGEAGAHDGGRGK